MIYTVITGSGQAVLKTEDKATAEHTSEMLGGHILRAA